MTSIRHSFLTANVFRSGRFRRVTAFLASASLIALTACGESKLVRGGHYTDPMAFKGFNAPEAPWTRSEYLVLIQVSPAFGFGRPSVFEYVIGFNHNDYSIGPVRVDENLQSRTSLTASHFVVQFSPSMELFPKPPAGIPITVSGTWDPVGPGQYDFSPGELYVNAKGDCVIRTEIEQFDKKVRFLGRPTLKSRTTVK